MGANLWGASPLWEYRLGLIVSKDNHEPKARASPRGLVWRKPECKRCEAEPGQELHRVRCALMMTVPDRITPGYEGPSAAASCPQHAKNRQ